jgi:hypothetical protein
MTDPKKRPELPEGCKWDNGASVPTVCASEPSGIIAFLDANGLNTTASRLQVKLDRIREALTRGHDTDEKAINEALLILEES